MLKEEYEKSFLDIATWLGGKYLDRLGEDEVFEKLTVKQQVALKTAKVNYDVLDKVKKKRELGELKNVWTPPLDGEEGTDQGQQKQASPVVAPAKQQQPSPQVASPAQPPQQQPAGQQQPSTQIIEKSLDLFKKARDIFGR